jgi:hypothetical protein
LTGQPRGAVFEEAKAKIKQGKLQRCLCTNSACLASISVRDFRLAPVIISQKCTEAGELKRAAASIPGHEGKVNFFASPEIAAAAREPRLLFSYSVFFGFCRHNPPTVYVLLGKNAGAGCFF